MHHTPALLPRLAPLLAALVLACSPAQAGRAVNGLTMMKRDLCHSFKLDCWKRHASPPARHPSAAAKPAKPRQSAATAPVPTPRPATAPKAETAAQPEAAVKPGAAVKPAAPSKPPVPEAKPQPPSDDVAAVQAATPAAPGPRARPAVPEAEQPSAEAAPPAAANNDVPIPRDRPALLPALPPVAGAAAVAPAPAAKTPATQTASIAPHVTTAGPPDCEQALRAAKVQFDSVPASFGKPGCPIADPVRLHGVETPSGVVRFPEGPVFSCRFARQFASWVSDTGSAVVLAQMNRRLETVATGPGYDCRHRNGDSSAKMSEHAAGDAVDITSMTLQDGTAIRMADALNPAAPAYAVLRALRTTACGYFTTVLGPGANAAHREHFHLDLGIHGKSASYRICA